MSYNTDPDGTATMYGGGTDATRFHNPYKVFEIEVDHADLSAGASDSVALTDFPTNVWICAVSLEIVEAFAGEADVAVSCGDTADADELFTSFNLDSVAAGWAAITNGAAMGAPRFEADYETAGGDLTFTATELSDLTAGTLKLRVYYMKPPLSTDT